MKRIKIRFQNREDTHVIVEVMKKGQIIALRGLIFIVPEPAIEVLDRIGARYENLGEIPWDHVVRALRDPASAAVQ